MKKYLGLMASAMIFVFGLSALPVNCAAQSTGTDTAKSKKRKKSSADTAAESAAPAGRATKTPTPTNNASAPEIASAQASGKVWVNTETGVYHKGGRWYGKTKQGKFMPEDDAKKSGYHQAKAEIGAKKS
jgi:hypothetical protein